MFCPNCSCELPAVAKFCVKCGSRVEVTTTAPRALAPFCVNCAKQLNPSDKFCSYCGQMVMPQVHAEQTISENAAKSETPQTQNPTVWDFEKMSDEELEQLSAAHQKLHQPISDSLQKELDLRASRRVQADSASPSPSQITTTVQSTAATARDPEGLAPQKSSTAPYARFVVLFLLCCLCASTCVFALFDAAARNATDFGIEVIAILLTLVFGWFGWTTCKRIMESEPRNEPKSKRRIRNLLVTSSIFALLFLGLAALLGSVIGENRAEAIQLNNDITRQKDLADRITKARNAVSNTIPSYVAMYAGIETDVRDYLSTLMRLREELPKYVSKFPAQSETTRKFMNTVEREIRRSDLLMKQIATAGRIASLDEYQQGITWRSEMLPLLDEEDALDRSK